MATGVFLLLCVVVSVAAVWDVARVKNRRAGRLPEDIQ